MGEKGNESAEQPDSETTEQPQPETQENTEEETEEKKEDVEKLRKVIKVDDNKEEKKEEKKEEAPKQEEPSEDVDLDSDSRDGLEQKRAILQSIKDFDFQIKKNQEEITAVNTKLDAVSKDLDDLVSLYEIVSEQMNPFVGLSKVTKKRLDALETFTKEIEDLKNRMGDVESFAVRAGADLKSIGEGRLKEVQKKDQIEGELDSEETFVPEMEGVEPAGETSTESDEDAKEETEEQEIEVESEPIEEVETVDTQISIPTVTEIPETSFSTYTDDDIDLILEKALGALSVDYKIDRFLDEFIESLKA
jgi:flagellar protein FlaC